MDDMARDIKYNLRSQTDKLENKTLKNLFGMQTDLGKSNRLILLIKKNRFKNKLVMWGIIALLVVSVLFVVYMSIAPDSTSTTEVHYVKPNESSLFADANPAAAQNNDEPKDDNY